MMDDLLVKLMLGEATEEEHKRVTEWLKEKPENERYYAHFRLIWSQSKELAVNSTVDENEAWKRFKVRTDKEPVAAVVPLNKWRSWYSIAAAILVLVGVGGVGYLAMIKKSASEYLTVKSDARAVVDTLPDGSVVTLNRRSSIAYSEDFNDGETRAVTLTGEAFFDVKPDKSKPFVIKINDVTVRVLGTSFNVKGNDRQTEVIVETGRVEVGKADKTIQINPQEKVTVGKDDMELEKETSNNDLYKYYRTNEFVCKDVNLPDLVERLNEIYQAKIVIENEKLKNLRINTTLRQKSLSTDLHVIGQTFDIKVEYRGDSIVLK